MSGAPRRPPSAELALLDGVGQWMRRGPYAVGRIVEPAAALTAEAQAALIEMMARESSVSFGGDMRPYWRARPRFFAEVDEWWIAHLDHEVAAWSAAKTWSAAGESIVFMEATNVMPAHRRAGFALLLTSEAYLREFARARGTPPLMAVRTENPIIYRAARKVSPRLFPSVERAHAGRAYEQAARVGARLAAELHPGRPFDPRTFAVRGALAFAGDLYADEAPRSGVAAVDALFERELDARAGDAFILVMVIWWRDFLRGLLVYALLRARLWTRRLGRR
jgi:GNAT superfamily N-acetyltransferase